MIKKRMLRIESHASSRWWSGFDREDLNRKAPMKQQRNHNDSDRWPYYDA